MANKELGEAKIFLSNKNSFSIESHEGGEVYRLNIEEPLSFGEGTSKETQDLMRSMMVAHMVAPRMPEIIGTNFEISNSELINELYRFYGEKKPRILKLSDQVKPEIKNKDTELEKYEVATSHSGGLDSVYRIAKILNEGEQPLAIHLKNLNAKGNAWEDRASEKQCKEWKVAYERIRLKNNSGNSGKGTMKTRDLLLGLAVAIQAAPHRVSRVQVEGGMSTDSSYQFSENSQVWSWFNDLVKETGLKVDLEGIDAGDIETIGEVIELEKQLGISILPMVQNCFSAPFQVQNNRRKWERETPNIARFSAEHWCGSCYKCRRMTLGRLFYADPRLENVNERELDYFINDTHEWIKKYPNNSEFISQSFLKHLKELAY